MSEALAEVIELDAVREAKYAHSHAALEALGAVAVGQEVQLGASEVDRAYADFAAGVREMLRTDKEFGAVLDIDDKRQHEVIDGQACDHGTPMVDIVRNGQRTAASTVRFRPEFGAQLVRDQADVTTAETADSLAPGESWIALSIEPKDELQEHPEIYKDYLGYKEGLAYLQWYSKADEDTMIAGSCSVDLSDEATWRELLAEEGVDIPPDESINTWILHGIKREMTPDQTEQYVLDLRNRYYQKRGYIGERYSVSEYVNAHGDVVEKIFMSYYPSLAHAAQNSTNNEVMQGLAGSMLQADLSKMKAGAKQQLIRVANAKRFDGEMVDTMDAIIRYVVVEELRKGLSAAVNKESAQAQAFLRRKGQILQAPVGVLNQHLAHNLQAGLQAGRSYGGCAGQVQLSEEMQNYLAGGNPQEAYGGQNAESRVGKVTKGKCVIASCPNHERVVDVGGCGVCLNRCQIMFDKGKDPSKLSARHEPKPQEHKEEVAEVIDLRDVRQETPKIIARLPDAAIAVAA